MGKLLLCSFPGKGALDSHVAPARFTTPVERWDFGDATETSSDLVIDLTLDLSSDY